MEKSSDVPLDSLGDILDNAPAISNDEERSLAVDPSRVSYYRRVDGEETGPFTIGQLQVLIDRDQLQKPDRVRQADSKCWLPCQEIAELVFRTVDRTHEKEIAAASSLLDELFSDAPSSKSSSDLPSRDDLPSMDDLPDVEESSPPEVSSHPENAPLKVRSDKRKAPKPSKRKAPKPDKPSRSSPKLPAAEIDPPESSSPSRSSPKLPVAVSDPSPPPPAVDAAMTSEEKPTASFEATRETQTELPTTPTQIAPPPRWNPPTPAPSKPAPAQKPKAKRKPRSGPSFSLPSKPLLLGLGGLILAFVVFKFWPGSSRGMQGLVAIDGKPLTVGSLSFLSSDPQGKGMSFSVIEGRFQSEKKVPDGDYDALIIVGSPLGIPVSQLENTPFASLNGARFKTNVTVSSDTPKIELDLPASQAIPLDKPGGADAVSNK